MLAVDDVATFFAVGVTTAAPPTGGVDFFGTKGCPPYTSVIPWDGLIDTSLTGREVRNKNIHYATNSLIFLSSFL